MPVMESKAADVFAFGMLAVEVFTGKIPFEGQTNETAVLLIARGDRPKMPENAQAVGLTGEIRKLLKGCWQQNPKKRPTMEDIVRRWEEFVENNNGDSVFIPGCVQITLVIRTSASVLFSTSHGRPREPRPPVGPIQGTSRPRLEAVATRPPTMPTAARLRTIPETARSRKKSEVAQQGTKFEAVQPRAQSPAPQPSESAFSEGYRSQVPSRSPSCRASEGGRFVSTPRGSETRLPPINHKPFDRLQITRTLQPGNG